jgi:hypothetical protein
VSAAPPKPRQAFSYCRMCGGAIDVVRPEGDNVWRHVCECGLLTTAGGVIVPSQLHVAKPLPRAVPLALQAPSAASSTTKTRGWWWGA